MKTWIGMLLALLSVVMTSTAMTAATTAAAPWFRRSPLARQIETIAKEFRGAQIAVAYAELDGSAGYTRLELSPFHAASTMKIPVMMAAFAAVDNGELKLDRPIPVTAEFKSLMDGSPYTLLAADDSDPELYRAVGESRPLADLLRRMITKSSNLATNLILERVGASTVNDLMRRLGALDGHVLRGVQDEKAYQARMNNTLSARDLLVLLKALASGGEGISESSRNAMLDLLKAQEHNEKIPSWLPEGTVVAHKTGDITGVHHDAAIVYPAGGTPYVLVVLTSGIADEAAANRAIAGISRAVWDARRAPAPGNR